MFVRPYDRLATGWPDLAFKLWHAVLWLERAWYHLRYGEGVVRQPGLPAGRQSDRLDSPRPRRLRGAGRRHRLDRRPPGRRDCARAGGGGGSLGHRALRAELSGGARRTLRGQRCASLLRDRVDAPLLCAGGDARVLVAGGRRFLRGDRGEHEVQRPRARVSLRGCGRRALRARASTGRASDCRRRRGRGGRPVLWSPQIVTHWSEFREGFAGQLGRYAATQSTPGSIFYPTVVFPSTFGWLGCCFASPVWSGARAVAAVSPWLSTRSCSTSVSWGRCASTMRATARRWCRP